MAPPVPHVLELCGVSPDEPERAIEIIDRALKALGDAKRARALRNAYSLEPGLPEGLEVRRSRFAEQNDCSPAAVRDWEDEAIGELLFYLLARHHPPAAPSPPWLLLRFDLAIRIVDKHWQSSEHRRELVAVANGLSHFRYGSSILTVPTNVRGATVERERVNPEGSAMFRFRFPRECDRGDRHVSSFTEVRSSNHPVDPEGAIWDMASQSFETPVLRYNLSVSYQGPRPRDIWRFQGLHRYERPGKSVPSNRLTTDQSGVVEAHFEGLYGGLCSGIAWRW
jgi:hypothetical protein